MASSCSLVVMVVAFLVHCLYDWMVAGCSRLWSVWDLCQDRATWADFCKVVADGWRRWSSEEVWVRIVL